MERLNKFILSEILCTVGAWPEIILLTSVCKHWSSLISEFSHYFTFQGVRHPHYIPSNLQIDLYLHRFKSTWKLQSLDLRNVHIEIDLLSEVLLNQQCLRKLDLTNTQISVG